MKWKLNFFLENSADFFSSWSVEFLLREEWDCEGLKLLAVSEGSGEADCDLSVVSRGESARNRELELDFLSILLLTGLPRAARLIGEGDLRTDPSSFLRLGRGLNIGLEKVCRRSWRSDSWESPWCWDLSCKLRESWEWWEVGPGDWREDWEEKLERRSLHGVLRLLPPANIFSPVQWDLSSFISFLNPHQASLSGPSHNFNSSNIISIKEQIKHFLYLSELIDCLSVGLERDVRKPWGKCWKVLSFLIYQNIREHSI